MYICYFGTIKLMLIDSRQKINSGDKNNGCSFWPLDKSFNNSHKDRAFERRIKLEEEEYNYKLTHYAIC